jgi:tryptophan synthase beta chain
MHAHLFETGRAKFYSVTDKEAFQAAFMLARTEGIIPALESAHAVAVLENLNLKKTDVVVVNLSGRGDKDLQTYITRKDEYLK